MAKGKKTAIKSIKKIDNDTIEINGKEYVIIEDTKDIETAITMKISSHGNRILRFEDLSKKATIDVKREINIIKYTFTDKHRASRFKKSHEKSIITPNDKVQKITTTSSHIKARQIISNFTNKDSESFDKQSGISTFYISQEVK